MGRSGSGSQPAVLPAVWFIGLSNLGDGIVLVLIPLTAVGRLSGTTAIASVVGSGWVAAALLSFAGGVLIDRHGTKRAVFLSQTIRAVCLLLVPFLLSSEFAPAAATLLLIALVTSSGEWLTDTAIEVSIGSSVAVDGYAKWFGRVSSMQLVANRLVGPAIGGVAFALVGEDVFWMTGAVYIVSNIALMRLAISTPPREAGGLRRTREVIVELVAVPWTRCSLIAGGGMALAVGLTVGPYVVFVQEVLALPDAAYGLLIAATSLGGVAGGLTARYWYSGTSERMPLVAAWVATGGAQVWFGTSSNLMSAAAASALFGVVATWVGVAIAAARQKGASADSRGVAGGLGRGVRALFLAVGAYGAGPLIGWTGLRAPWVAAGLIHLMVVPLLLVGFFKWPRPDQAGETRR